MPFALTNPANPANAAARLASLLDSAMDAIISVDEAQSIVLYNQAAERIFGWPAEKAIGQPLTMLIPERFRSAHGEHVRRFGSTGVTSRRMSGTKVVYGLRSTGEEFPVEASILEKDGIQVETQLCLAMGKRLGECISEDAKDWGADSIVLGSHGRKGIGRALLGSGAEQIIREAPVPALVIPGGS